MNLEKHTSHGLTRIYTDKSTLFIRVYPCSSVAHLGLKP